jgi:hypothetical protein
VLEIHRDFGQWRIYFASEQGDEQGCGVRREAAWLQSDSAPTPQRFLRTYAGWIERIGGKFRPHSFYIEVLEDTPYSRKEALRVEEAPHLYPSIEEALEVIADRAMTLMPNPQRH